MAAVLPTESTDIAGIIIPSVAPEFLIVVAAHVLVALAAILAGAAAMLAEKGPGRHHSFGTIYYWSLAAAFVSALTLVAMRWRETYPLAILGALAFAAATIGRAARRGSWRAWIPLHIGGMGCSYILMLTAFYVDNGRNLPLWRELPAIAYWLLPALIGGPLTLLAIVRRSPRR
jgi:uncharacterized membrane protein